MKYIRLIIFRMKPRNTDERRYKINHLMKAFRRNQKKRKLVNPWEGKVYDETDVKCIEWVNSLC